MYRAEEDLLKKTSTTSHLYVLWYWVLDGLRPFSTPTFRFATSPRSELVSNGLKLALRRRSLIWAPPGIQSFPRLAKQREKNNTHDLGKPAGPQTQLGHNKFRCLGSRSSFFGPQIQEPLVENQRYWSLVLLVPDLDGGTGLRVVPPLYRPERTGSVGSQGIGRGSGSVGRAARATGRVR